MRIDVAFTSAEAAPAPLGIVVDVLAGMVGPAAGILSA
jgi:hypothetical protein